MSCRDFERLVALHVEGDLEAPERQRVETHLRTCGSCRELAEELKETQSLFKSLRQDLPERTMLLGVRERVLDDIELMELGSWWERILFGFRQRATLAGIALLIAGSSVLWFSRALESPIHPSSPIAPVPPTVIVPEPLPVPLPQSVSRRRAPKVPVRRPRPAPVSPDVDEPHEQLTIKLLTDDPNVIIYWILDEKGD